jgi:hypothetical protein
MKIRYAYDNAPVNFCGLATESRLRGFIGIELEIDGRSVRTFEDEIELQCDCCGSWYTEESYVEADYTQERVADVVATAFNDFDEEQVFFAYDCSIGGVECKFQPSTYEHLLSLKPQFDEMFEELRYMELNDRFDSDNNAGMHVHLSNTVFADGYHMKRFIQFFQVNYRKLLRFAQREETTFCESTGVNPELPPTKFKSQYLANGRNRVKMQVVNTAHSNTVEVRAFAAPDNTQAFFAYVELCVLAVELTASPESDPRRFTWETLKQLAEKHNLLHLVAELS